MKDCQGLGWGSACALNAVRFIRVIMDGVPGSEKVSVLPDLHLHLTFQNIGEFLSGVSGELLSLCLHQ